MSAGVAVDATTLYPAIIAGRDYHFNEVVEIRSPWSGDIVGAYAACSVADLDSVLSRIPTEPTRLARHERRALLDRIADLVETRKEAAARLITAESGLSLVDTRHEVDRAVAVLRLATAAVMRADGSVYTDDVLPGGRGRRTYTLREPFELALAITPFNHPLNQVVHKLAPAFAVGTRVVLKPSAHTPLSAFWFARICLEAGLPEDWITVLCAEGIALPQALARHPRFEMLAFTGGTAAGRELAAHAGYKKLVLELGGSSPMIVLEDADIPLALDLATAGCFRNSGQRCSAVRRIFVPRKNADAFAEALAARAAQIRLGDPADEATGMGTLINAAAAERIGGRLRTAEADGARFWNPIRCEGASLAPCVLSGIANDDPIVREEAFGPIAPIIAYETLDEALSLANDTAYGLSAAVIGNNWEWIQKAITQIRAGSVNVNAEPGWRIESTPFGGIKASGLGDKEGVDEAMNGYSWIKTYSLPWDRP